MWFSINLKHFRYPLNNIKWLSIQKLTFLGMLSRNTSTNLYFSNKLFTIPLFTISRNFMLPTYNYGLPTSVSNAVAIAPSGLDYWHVCRYILSVNTPLIGYIITILERLLVNDDDVDECGVTYRIYNESKIVQLISTPACRVAVVAA